MAHALDECRSLHLEFIALARQWNQSWCEADEAGVLGLRQHVFLGQCLQRLFDAYQLYPRAASTPSQLYEAALHTIPMLECINDQNLPQNEATAGFWTVYGRIKTIAERALELKDSFST
jgi:hypothetical protein